MDNSDEQPASTREYAPGASPRAERRHLASVPPERISAQIGSAGSPWEWRASAPDASAAADLRRAFREYLVRHARPEADIAGAELIFAELLANVVRHAPGPASFRIDWEGEQPTLLVLDEGRGFANRLQPALPDCFAESGRGLALVRALAKETVFGDRPEGGAFVKVVLPVRRFVSAQ